jgi:carbon-monoxide dehydrogenase small subunit
MLITARDIVTRLGNPGEARVREELAGNLCRCTGYAGIVKAVQNVGNKIGARPISPAEEDAPAPSKKSAPMAAPSAGDFRRAAASTPQKPKTAAAEGTTVTHSFVIDAKRRQLWASFKDIRWVAGCIPGAELTGHDDRQWQGKIRVKMGPIRAQLAGAGTYELHDDTQRGSLQGSGADMLSGSRVSGSLEFRLSPSEVTSTRVDLTLDFRLQGMLAQFSRSSIAKEFVALIVRDFAKNVSTRLNGDNTVDVTPVSETQLDVFKLLRVGISSTLTRLFRRGRT